MSASDEPASSNQGDELPTEPAPPEAGEESGLLAELLETQSSRPDALSRPALHHPCVGRFCAWDAARGPLVDFTGNPGPPVPARSTIPLDPELVGEAVVSGRGVVLSFEGGRAELPIVTGLLQPLGSEGEPSTQPRPTAGPTTTRDEAAEVELGLPTGESELETRVDGRRVELEAADEIVLRCGKASIVLRRNGRVVIRGTYVETRSRGVNRIKGGSVEIN